MKNDEILVNIIGMIDNYFIKFFYMLILRDLSPVYIIFLLPIFYFFFKFLLVIYNLFYCLINHNFTKFFDKTGNHFLVHNFILDISGDLFCVIGFLIYLEIIELNCFQLNFNLRTNIKKRSFSDSFNSKGLLNYNDKSEDGDEDDDDNVIFFN